MANILVTDAKITRRALAILHNKATFLGTIGRQYDAEFGNEGGKTGNTLRIRLPNQYTVRTGATATIQATQETSVTLTMSTQKGVDLNFTSQDMYLSMDDFSDRVLEPAMAVLATSIESDVFNVYKQVYQLSGTAGANPADIAPFLNAKTLINRSLAPKDKNRNVQVNSAVSASMVGGLKALYQDDVSLSKQYLEGKMYRTSGFDFFENDIVPFQTNGTMAGIATCTVNQANQTGTTLVTNNWTAGDTITAGTVFTAAGCYMVHPETKISYGALQQFSVQATVTADSNGNATLSVLPAIIPTNPTGTTGCVPAGTVNASPNAGGAITVVGVSGGVYAQNLAYHKDFATFVTGDLPLPKGMDMAAREVYDGISLRFIRGYDVINDVFISRIDVLYGYLAMRPALASRVTS